MKKKDFGFRVSSAVALGVISYFVFAIFETQVTAGVLGVLTGTMLYLIVENATLNITMGLVRSRSMDNFTFLLNNAFVFIFARVASDCHGSKVRSNNLALLKHTLRALASEAENVGMSTEDFKLRLESKMKEIEVGRGSFDFILSVAPHYNNITVFYRSVAIW